MKVFGSMLRSTKKLGRPGKNPGIVKEEIVKSPTDEMCVDAVVAIGGAVCASDQRLRER